MNPKSRFVISFAGLVLAVSFLLFPARSALGQALVVDNGDHFTLASGSALFDFTLIGDVGAGTVSVSNGADLTTGFTLLGNSATGVAAVTLDGAGTTWALNEYVFTGHSGHASISITNGASLATGLGANLGYNAGSSGSISVSGAGSKFLNDGPTSDLVIGDQGTGSLSVTAGALVTSRGGFVGANVSTAVGSVLVDGAGSLWSMSGGMAIANRGTANLTIANGGHVSAVAGGAIGGEAGSHGTAAVVGAGSTLTTSNTLIVGRSGTATLTIANGGHVSDVTGVIGRNISGAGTVTVDGAGSMWTSSGQLTVGQSGTGSLAITNGGTVSNGGRGTIGHFAGSTGSATVNGAGSSWTNSGDLSVGLDGHGSLTIANGGTVSASTGAIGDEVAGSGVATVDGAGSSWNNSNFFLVGNFGDGALTVSNGGAITGATGGIGIQSGSSGTATVDGTGSTWTSSNDLYVGLFGTGSLTVANGGTVAANAVTIALSAGSTGTVTIDGGTLNTPTLTIGTGGTLNYNSSSLAAGAINSSTITNAGHFNINTRAPIAGSADARAISAVVTNQTDGVINVNLDDNASVAFSGAVNNDGYFKVTQLGGTSGGSVTFGIFNNNGTFVQDPTTTHFDSLGNNGLFEAGFGDLIIVDNGLVNNGTFNLTGSILDSAAGLVNEGTFNIYGGATINGAYSGNGSLLFHVGSAADTLFLDDLFTGSLEIIFDPGYSLFGTERFIQFGSGAYLTNLFIGGIEYDLGHLDGPGYLAGNGSFVATPSVPDSAGTTGCLVPILLLLAAIRRRSATPGS